MKFIPTQDSLREARKKRAAKSNRQQRRAGRGTRWINVTGLKRWFISAEEDTLTPYAIKEKKRRRAANKVARQSRKVNR